jgi:hypothetical protein
MWALRQFLQGMRESRRAPASPGWALNPRSARNFPDPKDTLHSRLENGVDFCKNPASGELSPVSFEDRKPTFSGGNWTICEESSQIAQTLRLYGGGSRERTILHRRNPLNHPNLGRNLRLPVIRPESVGECIGDLSLIEITADENGVYRDRLWSSSPRLRYSPGLAPTTRLKALLNAASDS